jgi:hypothetical protein
MCLGPVTAYFSVPIKRTVKSQLLRYNLEASQTNLSDESSKVFWYFYLYFIVDVSDKLERYLRRHKPVMELYQPPLHHDSARAL